MENPIFIIGLHRSGSTLWTRILEEAKDIFVFEEMYFINSNGKDFDYFFKSQIRTLSSDNDILKMINLIFLPGKLPGLDQPFWDQIKRFDHPKLRSTLYRNLAKTDKSLGSIFRVICQEIASFYKYYRYLVKFPVSLNHTPKLLQWFPKCKILHCTRDPRAIAMSVKYSAHGSRGPKLIRAFPNSQPIVEKMRILYCIHQYILSSKIHYKLQSHDNYSLFRYEALVNSPEKEIRRLCHFLDIQYNENMLHPREGEKSSITKTRAKGFDSTRVDRWKSVISIFEEKFITALTNRAFKK